jgi:hypothetical protein
MFQVNIAHGYGVYFCLTVTLLAALEAPLFSWLARPLSVPALHTFIALLWAIWPLSSRGGPLHPVYHINKGVIHTLLSDLPIDWMVQ